jgi:flagellar hook-length control protein FliK
MSPAAPVEAAPVAAPARGASSNAPSTTSGPGHFSNLLAGRGTAPNSTPASKAASSDAGAAAAASSHTRAPTNAGAAHAPSSTSTTTAPTGTTTGTASGTPAATNSAQNGGATGSAPATGATPTVAATPGPSADIVAATAATSVAGPAVAADSVAKSVLAGVAGKLAKTITGSNTKTASKRSSSSADVAPNPAMLAGMGVLLAPAQSPAVVLAGTDTSGSDESEPIDDAADTSAAAAGSSDTPDATPQVSRVAADAVGSALSTLNLANAGNEPQGANRSAAADPASAAGSSAASGVAALADLARALPNTQTQSSGTERSIAVPITDPNWSHAVAAQVQLVAASNTQSATLKLSPEHLGPVEVHIDVQSSQVNVSFSAAHAETRSALEQSVPVLRAMFAQSGLTLGQASVQAETRPGSQSFKSRNQALTDAAVEPAPIVSSTVHGVGLIDEYA